MNPFAEPRPIGASAAAPDLSPFEPPRISSAWTDTPDFLLSQPSEEQRLATAARDAEAKEHKLRFMRAQKEADQIEKEIREHQRAKSDFEERAHRLESDAAYNERRVDIAKRQVSTATDKMADYRVKKGEALAEAKSSYPLLGMFTDNDVVNSALGDNVVGKFLRTDPVVKAFTVVEPKAADWQWHADLEVKDANDKLKLHEKNLQKHTKKQDEAKKDKERFRKEQYRQEDEARELRRKAAIEDERINRLIPRAQQRRFVENFERKQLDRLGTGGGAIGSAGGAPNMLLYDFDEMDAHAQRLNAVLQEIENTLARIKDAQAALEATSSGLTSQAVKEKWDILEKANQELVNISKKANADLIELTYEMKRAQNQLADMLRIR